MSADPGLAEAVAGVLLSSLSARGVLFTVESGELKCKAPRGSVSAVEVEALKSHREALVALLTTAQNTEPTEAGLHAALLAAERAYGDLYPIWTAKHDELIAARAASNPDEPRLKQELDALLDQNHRLRAAYGAAEEVLKAARQGHA